jgi:hypothetical protein
VTAEKLDALLTSIVRTQIRGENSPVVGPLRKNDDGIYSPALNFPESQTAYAYRFRVEDVEYVMLDDGTTVR